jgi:patatin-like phospholipase/acyl hydrolase
MSLTVTRQGNVILSKKPPFKILSIDGGGIKGLYSSSILEKLEEYYGKKSFECFDMICGTSTGGLIALALSVGKSAKEISTMYKEKGEIIFPRRFGKILGQLFVRSKYSNKNLRKCLCEFVGDKTIGDSLNLLCIPSFNYTDSTPCVFKYDHKEGGLGRDNSKKMVDIGLATSAAPTYFPISQIGNHQFIDGGVWANNPAIVGLVEALCHFVGKNKKYGSIQILSISSLEEPKGKPIIKRKSHSVIHWGLHSLTPFMKGQIHFPHNALTQLAQYSDIELEYKRIESPILSKSQIPYVGLDKVSNKSLNFLRNQGETKADNCFRDPDVEKFFKTDKTYKTQAYGK